MSFATTIAPFRAVGASVKPHPGPSRAMVNSSRYVAALWPSDADAVTERRVLAPETLRLFGLLGMRHRGWW